MDYGQQCARLPKSTEDREQWERAVIVLEHCPLISTQTDRGWELLCQRHRNALSRKQVSATEMRPDVVHQVLLHLLDSPLSRAGKLQIFLHTIGGVLIAVDPRLRVPRAYRLFEKMICMLLHKMKVRSTVNSIALMKVIKNPVTDHLPTNAKFIRVEVDGTLVNPYVLCRKLADAARPTQQSAITHAARAPNAAPSAGADRGLRGGRGGGADRVDEPLRVVVGGTGDEAVPAALERLLQHNVTHAFQPFVFVVGGTARGNVAVKYAGAATSVGSSGPETSAKKSASAPVNLAGPQAPKQQHGDAGAGGTASAVDDASVRLSLRSMSAAAVCSMLCHALEDIWLTRAAA